MQWKSILALCLMIATFIPLQASTLALWGFNEGSGNTAYDLSGNNNNLSFSSGSLFSSNSPFSGGSSLVASNSGSTAAGSGTSLNVTGNVLTMEAWVKISAPNTTSQKFAHIVSKSSGSSADQPYWFGLENRVGGSFVNDRWQFEYLFTDQDGTRVHNQSTNLYLSGSLLNQWVHLAIVYDGRSSTNAATVTLYINGSPTVFTSHSGTSIQKTGADSTLRGNLLASEANLSFGAGGWGQDYWVDELRLSDAVLAPGTGSGINQLAFNANLAPVPEAQTWIVFVLGLLFVSIFKQYLR